VKVNVNFDAATFNPTPTLTGITATSIDGTPASNSAASADAGQVITLTGSNFNADSEIVFQTRDGSGNVAPLAVGPMIVNATGTATQGTTTTFSDNFESGSANAAWALNVVDASSQGVFTRFLGHLSNGGDTLNLTGLAAGQTYTLHFDYYALDSLDGSFTGE